MGRSAEQATLAGALAEARLVSAVGPGGVGKTRLALAVAAGLGDRFPGGVGYVDLVPVTDPAQVPATVAAALQVAEVTGRSREDGIVARLAGADGSVLLVLDNCEHVVNTAAVLLERLLTDCPDLRVLVTSRTRLVVPFERVVPVAGLAPGEARSLLAERAAAAGGAVDVGDERVATLCRALDGSALAIELAAARIPVLGLDGLTAGLGDQLGLLTGGPRLQPRHRSVLDTLDWSYRLLDPVDQAVLRRVAVFAAPFTADAAAAVTGIDRAAGSLGRLVDHSLLVAEPGADGAATRYRALETIRQFGAAQVAAAAEDDAYARHLDWCLAVAAGIDAATVASVDAVADDLRAAVGWASAQPDRGPARIRLAHELGRLLFLRGRLTEAQQRDEQAGEWAVAGGHPATATAAFADAAGVAKCRVAGEDALRLDRAAAAAAQQAGDLADAAAALTRAAEHVGRFRGMYATPPPPGIAPALLAEARALGISDPRTQAAIAVTEAGTAVEDDVDLTSPAGAAVVAAAIQALALAKQSGDPLIQSAALDLINPIIGGHDAARAAASARRRVDLLSPLPLTPATAFELKDALHMAVLSAVGAGDLDGARRLGRQQRDLPFLRDEPDHAYEELLLPTALAADWEAMELACRRFVDGWHRAGRPVAPGRSLGPSAVVMAHGLRGDRTAQRAWLGLVAALRGLDEPAAALRGNGYGEIFDAVMLLHQARTDEVLALLSGNPAAERNWYARLLHQWRRAVVAEASGDPIPDASDDPVDARVRAHVQRLVGIGGG